MILVAHPLQARLNQPYTNPLLLRARTVLKTIGEDINAVVLVQEEPSGTLSVKESDESAEKRKENLNKKEKSTTTDGFAPSHPKIYA